MMCKINSMVSPVRKLDVGILDRCSINHEKPDGSCGTRLSLSASCLFANISVTG